MRYYEKKLLKKSATICTASDVASMMSWNGPNSCVIDDQFGYDESRLGPDYYPHFRFDV